MATPVLSTTVIKPLKAFPIGPEKVPMHGTLQVRRWDHGAMRPLGSRKAPCRLKAQGFEGLVGLVWIGLDWAGLGFGLGLGCEAGLCWQSGPSQPSYKSADNQVNHNMSCTENPKTANSTLRTRMRAKWTEKSEPEVNPK